MEITMDVQKLSDITAKPIKRASTGFDELDYIYGYSKFPNMIKWGMPQGKISLWSGGSGIGKSRLCIEVAKNIAKVSPKWKVLYFQTESTLEDFAGWAKDTTNYTNFFCSGESRIEEIIKIISEIKPHIVFIDSVNEIDEFENGTKRETRRLIKGITEDNILIKPGLKHVCNDIGCHLILLGQVNQDGSIKGGTSLPHMVDIALELEPYDENVTSIFTVKVGVKHRHGKRDSIGVFIHTDLGIECVSSNRLGDKVWCESKNIAVTTVKDRVLEKIANTEYRNIFGEEGVKEEEAKPTFWQKFQTGIL